MQITVDKTLQIVSRFARIDSIQQELASVHVKGQHIEATDSYSFIRVTNKDTNLPEAMLDAKAVGAVKFDKGIKQAERDVKTLDLRDFKYPDVTPILDNVAEQKEYTEVLLDPEFLLKVAKGLNDLTKGGKLPRITLRVTHKFMEPVRFETQTPEGSQVLALLMPCRNF